MPSTRTSARQDVTTDTIVGMALDMIATEGLAALSLRPLAQRVGVSTATISSRVGTKEQIIQRVIETAFAGDRAFAEKWRAIASGLGSMNDDARAALCDLAFRDWISAARRHAILLIELVHDRALKRVGLPILDDWLDQAGRFWSALLFDSVEMADLALGYILDEAGFVLGGGHRPAYSVLRVLCLKRLVTGIFPSTRVADAATFSGLVASLEPAAPVTSGRDDPKRRLIARSAAHIIVSRGMEAVTHRSVASATGVPASTVVYHFGARAALVVAGLHEVIAQFHGSKRDDSRDGAASFDADAMDLVKATSMIALASARDASLIPYALDMRRRRGENIRIEHLAKLGIGADVEFDRLAAQVVSIALFGMLMIDMARGSPDQGRYRAAFTALDDWRGHRTA